ncbi:hypothetical protein Scep_019042 [Stephania cephalantha]|uniref:Uncharacterized protein n=1 Tax=Stephania cephalantha TaxID=152367 RepID=A0AAP0IA59_9MAGN
MNKNSNHRHHRFKSVNHRLSLSLIPPIFNNVANPHLSTHLDAFVFFTQKPKPISLSQIQKTPLN